MCHAELANPPSSLLLVDVQCRAGQPPPPPPHCCTNTHTRNLRYIGQSVGPVNSWGGKNAEAKLRKSQRVLDAHAKELRSSLSGPSSPPHPPTDSNAPQKE